MYQNLTKKLKESLFSILPVVLIVFAISLFLVDVPGSMLVKFGISSVILFLGIGLFSLGADTAMMPIGQNIASTLTKTKKLWILLIACLLMGLLITIAEPDLSVLASQIPSLNKWVFIITVGIGVGLCFVLGAVRILFNIPLSYLLCVGYMIIFILIIFVPKTFWAIAFDASGVTTGTISVPFIMSFCLGISAVRGSKSNQDDSFGLVAICSLGPILSVLILGLFTKDISVTSSTASAITTSYTSIAGDFGIGLLHSLQEVALVLLPIVAIFILFQVTMMKLPKTQVIKIFIGLGFTYIGIVLFMTGVNVGFSDLGNLLGQKLVLSKFEWLIYPLSFILGYVIVAAEPAVIVLIKQVAEVSGNTIQKKTLRTSLSIGVGISLLIAVIRAVFDINIIYFLLPMYVISLTLSFYNPKLFTAVGFDAGGISSGPMAATFLLPFVTGIALANGTNMLTGAFGTVALIATTPILVVQVLGAIAKYSKQKHTAKLPKTEGKIVIIDYDYDIE